MELERQFGRSFDGRLEIGELTGNLLNRLSARDVQIRDASGRLLLRIDSVVVHPSWRDVFDRRISTGEVTLIRPEIHLIRGENRSWNVSDMVRPRSAASQKLPWSFHAARLSIRHGRIVTTNLGNTPRSVADSLVFDYANAAVEDVAGRLIVDWQPEMKLIDVLELTARLPQHSLDLHELRGQFLMEGDRLALNEVHVLAGSSEIHVAGSLSSVDDLRHRPGAASLELDLSETILDGEELRRLFPLLPLREAVTAVAHVQGPLSNLVVEELAVGRGESEISVEATLVGLPDTLDYEVSVLDSRLSWQDLVAVWPENGVPAFDQLGIVAFEGNSTGTLEFARADVRARLEASADIRVESRAGRIHGESQIEIGGDGPTRLEGTVDALALDVGLFTRNPDWTSSLTGRAALDAEGQSVRGMSGEGSIALSHSAFAGRSIDTLRVELAGEPFEFTGDVLATRGSGFVFAAFAADLRQDAPVYRLSGAARNLDLGPMLLDDSLSSQLNTRFSVTGSGRSWEAFEGDVTLEFDSSSVRYGIERRIIPAHHSQLAVRQMDSGDTPRIRLRGDVAELEITGDVAVAPFAELAAYWVQALRDAAEKEQTKYYRPAEQPGLADEDGLASFVKMESAAASLERAGLSRQRISASLKILRSDILSSLLPMLPAVRTDAEATAVLDFAVGEMDLRMSLRADSFHVGRVRSYDLDALFESTARTQEPLSDHVVADFSIAASSVTPGDQTFLEPSLTSVYEDGGFDLEVQARAPGAEDALRLEARMDLLEDRNRLTVRELQLAARDQTWISPEDHAIDFYRDAIVVQGLRLERDVATAPESEYLFVTGALSASPDDTLVVDARNVLLESMTRLLAVERPLGGYIDGRLALTGLKRQPELTGDVTVTGITYEDRFLGNLTLSSRYIPGSPDVALTARLRPAAAPDSSYVIEESDLAVEGTFRLPGRRASEDAGSPGALDLDVNVTRADAFFLEYIFRDVVSDVDGWLSGGGRIGGSFQKPLFEAELELHDGKFFVPEFRLQYAASGPVSVDRSGIHLNRISVSDPDGGEAYISGGILFNDYSYFSFDLAGRLDELRIMNVGQSRELPFYGRISASGNMTLTGPLSNATLQSDDARTTSDSDLYIPISESGSTSDAGFIVFADSTGHLPDISRLTRRSSLLAERPSGERLFLEGLEIDLNISAPQGSTVHLVIDPLLGDVINAVGSGQIQLVREEGEFSTFGTFDVSSGDYLFTAGEVFFRRFLIDSGSITWDRDPLNAVLNITASYRTRASTDGLPIQNDSGRLIPLIIRLNVSGRVASPSVDLALAVDRDDHALIGGYEGLEALLNQPELAAQYATSVLLTNSFLLTSSAQAPIADSRNQLAFNSLSQLVASQLNRYLNYALPSVDLNLGVQGESAQDLDVTYGVALRLLDERLIIRGQGIYQNEMNEDRLRRSQQGMLDEFVVELRLSSSVSIEVFYRREGDVLSTEAVNTSTTGAGLSYQTEFSTWQHFVDRLFGRQGDRLQDEGVDDVVADTGE